MSYAKRRIIKEIRQMRFFGIDSPLYKFMTTLLNVFLLSFCVVIGSLPIVTVGASVVAGFSVGLRMVANEEGYIVRQFFKAYKENLKQGIPLGLIALLCAYVIYLDTEIVSKVENVSIFAIMFMMVSAAVFTFTLLYSFALTARYENTLMRILKNSFRISMKFFVRTLALVFLLVLEVLAFLWNYTTIFIGIILGPALMILTVCLFARPIFMKLEGDAASGE